jgi:hypothetical protein
MNESILRGCPVTDRDDYTYFHVLEARRAAQLIARAAGMTDDRVVDSLASKVGRQVASEGSVTRGQVIELIQEAQVSG